MFFHEEFKFSSKSAQKPSSANVKIVANELHFNLSDLITKCHQLNLLWAAEVHNKESCVSLFRKKMMFGENCFLYCNHNLCLSMGHSKSTIELFLYWLHTALSNPDLLCCFALYFEHKLILCSFSSINITAFDLGRSSFRLGTSWFAFMPSAKNLTLLLPQQ